jgi:hypothetical protein
VKDSEALMSVHEIMLLLKEMAAKFDRNSLQPSLRHSLIRVFNVLFFCFTSQQYHTTC